jgi:integrase/recombinase XerD
VSSFGEAERDVASVRLAHWGRVVPDAGVVPWLVVDPSGEPVAPVRQFLVDFVAQGNRAGSVRSYAYDLLRWWRWLHAVDVGWSRATSTEVRDFVLWLNRASKPRRAARTVSAATAGTVNPVTRKQHLGDRYQPRTVRHSNAVLRAFYEFWIERGEGPLINPVPLDRPGGRPNVHHNPMEPFQPDGRIRYNPKVPKRAPRAMPDERWRDLFAAMSSNRDRAVLALAISTAARASELLGLRGGDIDWGDQLIRVRRKGSGAEQWLPASSESFVWLRLYVADIGGDIPADGPIWLTLRKRRRSGGALERGPLNYEALRAVLRRANVALGSNWTMHDARHTCAIRMVRDDSLSLRDIQTILAEAQDRNDQRTSGDRCRERAPNIERPAHFQESSPEAAAEPRL